MAIMLIMISHISYSQIVISGYMANPTSSPDSNYEYVQLVATQSINFATTPYSVVVTNSSNALSSGWVAGGTVTYGFNLNSGSVVAGQTFYVGGSAKRINSYNSTDMSSLTWIRTINNDTTAGDGLGSANLNGVVGNAGTAACGIGVFLGLTSSLDSTKVPIDALFYGNTVGAAKPTTGGYNMPTNDRYTNSLGVFGSTGNAYLFNNSTSGAFIQLTGIWNTLLSTPAWTTIRTGAAVTVTTTSPLTLIASKISLYGVNPVADTVKNTSVTYITNNSAVLKGNVSNDGNTTILLRGFCYDTLAAPDTSKNKVTVAGTTGDFTATISGLLAGKTYHYRAFAINSVGISYAGDSTFTTLLASIAPTVTTGTTININNNSALASGNVISDGGSTIQLRGVCYDTTANPTVANYTMMVSGTTGAYTAQLTGLIANKTYHVRAYATTSAGSSYGADSTFKTLQYVPTYPISQVRTINATTGVADSLTVNCKLIGVVHGLNYIATGYTFYLDDASSGINVYKTSTLSTYTTVTEGDQLRVIGKIQQTSGLIQIVPDSIVKLSSGMALNTPVLATTLNDGLESRLVTIDSLTYISGWPTTGGAAATILAKHGTDTTTIILYTGVNMGTTAPVYLFSITGLVNQLCTTSPYLTKYRIYPRYIADLNIHYITPSVTTTSVNTITTTTAICVGNVTSDGGSTILTRGICYDTLAAPDTSKLKVIVTGTTGTYSANLTGLKVGKLYHYRAFAKNAIGVSYGGDSTFTTSASAVLPIVLTGTSSNIGNYSSSFSGTVTNDGGASVTSRGVCWSTVALPSITDSHTSDTGTVGTFTSSITGLSSNTLYHVRAYATTSAGTGYGADSTFTTKAYVPVYTIAQVRTINATTGVADSIGVNCKLVGVATGINYTATGYNFFLLDANTGINVNKTTALTYTFAQGDSLRVMGKIQQTNGLIQIVPDSIVKIGTGTLKTPLAITQLKSDSLESRLVSMSNLTYLSGWPTATGQTRTVYALRGTDSVIVYIYLSNLGTTAPPTSFNITGLVSQSCTTSPYLTGYQLYPRTAADYTLNYSTPFVLTAGATNIYPTMATLNGNVTGNGGYTITSRGICLDTLAGPDTSKTKIIVTGTTGTYSANFTNLIMGKTYHYRAYAINSAGITYGGDSIFTTTATPVVPLVTTGAVSSIGTFNATVAGTITYNGNANVTTKGVCYATTYPPTIANSFKVDTSTTTTISSTLSNLASSTHYFARAYATNSAGTGYGDTVSFTTLLNIPTYAISQVKHTDTAGTADSNNVNCKLIGVVNSINYTATGYQFYILDQNNGMWVYRSAALSNYATVTKGDSLRVIGKITMNSAAAYGMISIVPDSLVKMASGAALQQPLVINQLTSDTLESRLVRMSNLYYLSGWSTGTGNRLALAAHGSDTIQIRLTTTCNLYNTTAPPTGVPFTITGFVLQASANTTPPYVGGYRIYPRDTNDLVISYSAPVVTTGSTTGITQYTAICAGNVVSDGGKTITMRGICYDTLASPDTSKLKVIVTGTTGTFSANLSNLKKGKLYHYKAFALNSLGLTYGPDSTFNSAAAPVPPVVTTGTISNIGENTAYGTGTITNNGGDSILSKGICWGTTPNITIANSHYVDTTSSLTNIIGYLTGLNSSTHYYVRAYATNVAGTGYGDTVSFTTLLHIPTYPISQVKLTDNLGNADSIGVNCKLIGVVNSINYLSTGAGGAGYQFEITDPTGSIFVFKTATLTSYATVTRGDSLKIIGKISQNNGTGQTTFYGTTAIVPDSIMKFSSGGAQITPTNITSINNDSVESKLVKLTNLYYISGWTTAFGTKTVLFAHGPDTVTVRIPNTCNIYNVAAPTTTVAITLSGFVLQSATSAIAPYVGNYRLWPRDTFDYVVNYANPSVLTTGSFGVTQTSAICYGNIPTDGGHAITARGIAYDTLAAPLATGTHLVVTGTTGTYTGNLSGLLYPKTYHYRAYCTNSLGTFYGADSMFTTSANPVVPVVTTNNATNITTFSAAVTANIINNGGDTLTAKGICWSINSVPTLTDSVYYYTGTATAFTDTIKNLLDNKTYYARGFAISAAGTGYGNIIMFTTVKTPPTYTIAQVRTVNATTGVADSLGVNCKLTGTVHGINFSNNVTAGITFFICDANSGINVYKAPNTLGYTVTQGDMIRVIGKITQVNGLIEIVPDSLVVISSGNTLQIPTLLTTLDDAHESRMVKMSTLIYVSGWPTTAGTTAATVKAYNGTDTITLSIGRYCNIQGTPAPTSPFHVIGLESQNDATNPYTSGYYIYPRDTNDIIKLVGINEFDKPTFSVYPNPTNGNFSIALSKYMDADVKIYSVIGSLIEQRTIKASFTEFNISTYGKGMYLIQITDLKNGLTTTEKLIVK